MSVNNQIKEYISAQPEAKRAEMDELHRFIMKIMPGSKMWFLDGKNSEGKIVSNPSIGYGSYLIKYADGSTKEFYQIGLSANTSGISVYIMGLKDKTFLAKNFGDKIGKATVTGYCIKFKTLKDVNKKVLESAIRSGIQTL